MSSGSSSANRHSTRFSRLAKVYLTAFEQGQLSADECAPRIRALKTRLEQLARRKNDLERELVHEPAGPSEAAIRELRTQLAEVFKHGTPGWRKAIIEAHLAEVTLAEGKIVPVFRVPRKAQMPVEDPTGTSNAVRAMQTMAPRLGLEPRTYRLTAGCSAN
jgi:site-specific DNA recombinase